MKAEHVNTGIANVMGLKPEKVIATTVRRHIETGEFRVTMDVIATEKQATKLKELLIKNLQEE